MQLVLYDWCFNRINLLLKYLMHVSKQKTATIYVVKIDSHTDRYTSLVLSIEHNLTVIKNCTSKPSCPQRPLALGYVLYTISCILTEDNRYSYDVDTASPTTEFPVSRYTRLRMYNGTPLARNNQRGVVITVALELELKSSEVLYVNRDNKIIT